MPICVWALLDKKAGYVQNAAQKGGLKCRKYLEDGYGVI